MLIRNRRLRLACISWILVACVNAHNASGQTVPTADRKITAAEKAAAKTLLDSTVEEWKIFYDTKGGRHKWADITAVYWGAPCRDAEDEGKDYIVPCFNGGLVALWRNYYQGAIVSFRRCARVDSRCALNLAAALVASEESKTSRAEIVSLLAFASAMDTPGAKGLLISLGEGERTYGNRMRLFFLLQDFFMKEYGEKIGFKCDFDAADGSKILLQMSEKGARAAFETLAFSAANDGYARSERVSIDEASRYAITTFHTRYRGINNELKAIKKTLGACNRRNITAAITRIETLALEEVKKLSLWCKDSCKRDGLLTRFFEDLLASSTLR